MLAAFQQCEDRAEARGHRAEKQEPGANDASEHLGRPADLRTFPVTCSPKYSPMEVVCLYVHRCMCVCVKWVCICGCTNILPEALVGSKSSEHKSFLLELWFLFFGFGFFFLVPLTHSEPLKRVFSRQASFPIPCCRPLGSLVQQSD